MIQFSTLRQSSLALLTFMLVSGVLTGCGKKAQPTDLQDEVDFSDASNLFSAPLPAQRKAPAPDTVVAVVNGDPITYADLQKEVNVLLVSSRSANLPPERLEQMRSKFAEQAMQNVIVKHLLVDAVEKEDIAAEPAEVEEQVSVVTSNLPEDTTLAELLKRNNLSEEEFRRDLELSLRVQKLLQAKVAQAEQPTPQAVEEFYNQNIDRFVQPESLTIRHLLVAAEETEEDAARVAARAKAEDLRQQIVAGADFSTIVTQHSDDASSRERGGLLGNIRRNVMQKPLNDAAFSLQAGELSDVVETPYGYHLLLVEALNPQTTLALTNVTSQIQTQLTRLSEKQALDAYVETLKDGATIEFPGAAPVHEAAPAE